MDNICAIATPAGGALGIIRVSGPEAISLTASIFKPAGPTDLTERQSRSLTFGTLVAPDTREIIDEVLISVFRAPHSYTGENSTEITCHGSEYILTRAVQLLIEAGCRMAKPGEFTKRAFLNGKMDLSQAEAVADLIASNTKANHDMAMSQMRGGFSSELRQLRDQLLHITSLLELELDFSDHEDLEFASRKELSDLADKIHTRIQSLCRSFKLGNALKRGIPIAIVGHTNAGKSTLLNALVGEERALVSNIHGTTRDTIEETITLNDTLVRFIDTAGIRETTDEVERMGIERAYHKMEEADIVILLLDLTDYIHQFEALKASLLPLLSSKQTLILLNKRDLTNDDTARAAEEYIERQMENLSAKTLTDESVNGYSTICKTLVNEQAKVCSMSSQNKPVSRQILAVCAKDSSDIQTLQEVLNKSIHHIKAESSSDSSIIISNLRHYEALASALASIDRVIEGLAQSLPGDLISMDLRECIHHLSSITGDITTDAVLQNIFKQFCIGK